MSSNLIRAIAGGFGHTILLMSKVVRFGPCTWSTAFALFLLWFCAGVGIQQAAVASVNTLIFRIFCETSEFERAQNISILSIYCNCIDPSEWQVLQKAMLFSWSFTNSPACADACGWWHVRQLRAAGFFVFVFKMLPTGCLFVGCPRPYSIGRTGLFLKSSSGRRTFPPRMATIC